jgi:DNA mismatch repair protein MutL
VGRIRILPDAVANQIAAGEVVERPASVVKELLENSLDAGATDIRVEVEAGGRKLIRISDNGHGMLRDDAMLAFERHATSKIASAKELFALSSLGFRGEALPSIASVSRLTLESRANEERVGSRVEIAGGKMIRCEESAQAQGTTITVRDLFFNLPARRKFLRSEQTELAHIASLVTHYSLAHHDKSFSLRHNLSDLLNVSPTETLRDRVFQVFGAKQMEDLIDMGVIEKEVYTGAAAEEDQEAAPYIGRFRLRGFVSRPQVQKLNRNSIYLFVNGRLIRDRLLMHAISAGYHNLIPPSTWPFALLFLDCPAEEVDVNVHPSKTEVRFRHGSQVHDFVRDALRHRLTESRPLASLPAPTAFAMPQPALELPYSEFSQRVLENQFAADRITEPSIAASEPTFSLRPDSLPPMPQRFDFGVTPDTQRIAVPSELRVRLPIPDTHGPLPPGAIPLVETDSLAALKDLRPLGQIHDSFIIAAGSDGLWIIDQHVAHERILFEQVMKRSVTQSVAKQQLLTPMTFELSVAQQFEYSRMEEELHQMGFETQRFGPRTIAVSAAPAGLDGESAEHVLMEVLDIAESEFRKASLDEIRRGIAATVACRAAIKINMHLEEEKIRWLLEELGRCDYPMACPHGRPVAMRYSTREILKSFHRI